MKATTKLINSLRKLSARLRRVALEMDYAGPLTDTFERHAGELRGAAGLVEEWASEIERGAHQTTTQDTSND